MRHQMRNHLLVCVVVAMLVILDKANGFARGGGGTQQEAPPTAISGCSPTERQTSRQDDETGGTHARGTVTP